MGRQQLPELAANGQTRSLVPAPQSRRSPLRLVPDSVPLGGGQLL